ncbi:hypothetical protein RA8CHR_02120 [Variovorax sp. RA8]|nr:hypothetical protein RA8CHR_02120 [Variovorax sp. RA8]
MGGPGFLFVLCAWCESGAGISPRRASHFLCLAKESNQRKATPLAATRSEAAGNLRCSLFAGSAQTRFAQTRAALIREKLRSSARPEGTWNPTRHGASLCGVQVGVSFGSSLTLTLTHTLVLMRTHWRMHLHLFQALRSKAVDGRAKQWPDRSPRPSARAEERSFRRKKGRACLSEASLRAPRLKRAPQVARSEAEGRAQWGRLSLVTFFGETKKVTRPPGRNPGSGLNRSATYKQKAQCSAHAALPPSPLLPPRSSDSSTPPASGGAFCAIKSSRAPGTP